MAFLNTPAGSDTIWLPPRSLHSTGCDKAALHSQHTNITTHTPNTHINHTMQAGPVPPRAQSTPRPHFHTRTPCLFPSIPDPKKRNNRNIKDTHTAYTQRSPSPRAQRQRVSRTALWIVPTLCQLSDVFTILMCTQPQRQYHKTVAPASMMIGALTSIEAR